MIEIPRRPNLFIIGAMKSGTTTLHEYLDSHPQIAMSRIKEPGFFVEELTLRQGEDWYLSLFEQDDRFRYRGESSTHYTKLPVFRGVAERLSRFNPEARLIYIMRNPIERLVSHYWHNIAGPTIWPGETCAPEGSQKAAGLSGLQRLRHAARAVYQTLWARRPVCTHF